MKGQNIGYIRVSTLDQNEERQLEGIRQAGIELDEVFIDKASGKSTQRPKLEECLRYVRKGDTLCVWSIDRLARNLFDLEKLMKDLTARGVTIRFVKENMVFGGDDANPMQKLLLQILGSFAEFERNLIRERQREGLELVKQQGRSIGGGRAVKPEEDVEIQKRVEAGESMAKIAKDMGFSRQTVYRHFKQMKIKTGGN